MATVGRSPRAQSARIVLRPRRLRTYTGARRKVIAGLAVFCLIALWLAPWLVGRSGLRQSIVNWAVPNNGRIEVGSASLGWFSSIGLTDVRVFDADGKSLLTVDSLTLDRSLLGLALNSRQLGTIQFTGPVAHLAVDDQGSNFEETFAPLFEGPSDDPIKLKLAIVDGVLHLDDRTSDRQYHLQNLNGSLAMQGDQSPIAVELEGMLPTAAQPASFAVHLQTGSAASEDGSAIPQGELECQIEALPLEMLQPFLRRSLADAEIGGRLYATTSAKWGTANEADLNIEGELRATNFELSAAALRGERISLDEIDLPCLVRKDGKQLTVELEAKTDLGRLAAVGGAPLRDWSTASLIEALSSGSYEASGKFDIARLTQMLPSTLRLREGLQITHGQIELEVQSEPGRGGSQFTGELTTSDIEAVLDDEEIAWKQPLSVTVTAHRTATGLVIDEARCDSTFLQITAQGAVDKLTATASYDLSRLMSEVRQFAELPDVELSGQGRATAQFARSPDGDFQTSGQLTTTNFQLVTAGRRPWKEPSLRADFKAAGRLADWTIASLRQAELDVIAGDERLGAALVESSANKGASDAWPIAIDWTGDLAEWLPRIEPWVKLDGWQLSGKGNLTALVIRSTDGVDVQNVKLQVKPLHAWGPKLFIDEPSLQLAGNASWTTSTSRCLLSDVALDVGGLRTQVAKADLVMASNGSPQLTGQFTYEADLQRLDRWFHNPQSAPQWRMAGKAAGNGDIKRTGAVTTGRIETMVDNLQLDDYTTVAGATALVPVRRGATAVTRSSPVARSSWREKQLSLVAAGAFDEQSQTLQLEQLDLNSTALAGKASGKVVLASANRSVDLEGQITYDWQTLAPLWRPYLGSEIDIVGRDTRRFAIRGPLAASKTGDNTWIKELSAEAGLRWDKADLFGVEAGPAEVTGRLAQGVLQLTPLDVQVAEGRVRLAPQFRLSPGPAEMRLPRGPLITEVRVTPEICARGLKYIAPMLAEATRAEGKFSIDLEGARLPLSDLAAGDLAGKLSVHKVDVKPGPLADQLIFLGRQIEAILKRRAPSTSDGPETLLSMENQEVEFRMVDRRVYHRGIKFDAGGVPVTTHGSVGLDETLAIIAEVPIDASWIGNDPALSGLRGQTLQIPIEGTLKKPRLDRSAIEKLSGQLIKNTARGILFNELNKQLEKLVPATPEE